MPAIVGVLGRILPGGVDSPVRAFSSVGSELGKFDGAGPIEHPRVFAEDDCVEVARAWQVVDDLVVNGPDADVGDRGEDEAGEEEGDGEEGDEAPRGAASPAGGLVGAVWSDHAHCGEGSMSM